MTSIASDECRTVHKRIGLHAYLGTFGASIFVQGLTIVQGVLVARLLGPVGRGELATVILWPTMFAAIGIFGSHIALARMAATSDRCDSVMRAAIILAVITSTIASVLCYLILPYLVPEQERHLLRMSNFFIAYIALNHITLNVRSVDQGKGNFRRFNLVRVLFYPVYVSMLVLMWVFGVHQVQWAVAAMLIGHLVVVITRLTLILKDGKLFGRVYPLKEIARESMRFGLVGAVQPLYLGVDRAVLLWMLGATDLGLYTVALHASAVIGSITTSAGFISFTVAARAESRDGFRRVGRIFRGSALFWCLFGVPLALAMPLLLPLIYGREFGVAVNPARMLIVGSAFAELATLLDQSMRGQGRAFVGLEGRVAGLILMGALGVALSKYWNLAGMCVAYGVGQLAYLVVIVYRCRLHYRLASYSAFIPKVADARIMIGWLRALVPTRRPARQEQLQ